MQKTRLLAQSFRIPLIVLIGILFAGIFHLLNQMLFRDILLLLVIALGSFSLFEETLEGLLKKHFALDYIAILAIVVGVVTQEYFVAAVIALMIASGRTLEEYGISQAKKSLTKLIDRIPDKVTLWDGKKAGDVIAMADVSVGQEILIRKGEVIALDGELLSNVGLTDESSLTGEPYVIDKVKGDLIRSGTINMGDPIVIKVTKAQKDATYTKIIQMVQNAQNEKAPLVRLADKYSTIFTAITFIIATAAYIISGYDLSRVLAVLVVATPCPLILATPIALMGGVNAAAKKRIIIKKLASLEVLSRVSAVIFDKTGTITLGKPCVSAFETKEKDKDYLISIAEAIERNSLHPLAKAIVSYAKEQKVQVKHALKVTEKVGKGIQGEVDGELYTLSKLSGQSGMAIGLFKKDEQLGVFTFEDEIKRESKATIKRLKTSELDLYIFTGDKQEAAEKVLEHLGEKVEIRANCTPEDKQQGILELKKKGKVTAMVGDGINDAPALALADVGMVFSNEEQTAASEAADIVFLGGDFSMVTTSHNVANATIAIAMQSILWGIGLSILSMLFAAAGVIPPLFGAGIQEVIDVAVIINALRASRV